MRRPIVAGNWKMHCTRSEAKALIAELVPLISSRPDIDVVICPPYTLLAVLEETLEGTRIALGAQNMFWKPYGAYTGQISAHMLLDLSVRYVIIGHSERRGRFGVPEPDFDDEILRHFGDSDATVNRKLRACLDHGLTPICCVGETLGERSDGGTDGVVMEQTKNALSGVDNSHVPGIVFAYEPVWAIGTGEVCDSAEANRVCGVIRSILESLYGSEEVQGIRIQYGGSVKPGNAVDLLSQPNIDGALVGGASLQASDFAAIVQACPRRDT